MKIEESLPAKETVQKLGISLETILHEIKDLSPAELRDAPREFILKGKIDTKILRELQKLGVEFSVAGEKDRLVFSTGREYSVQPKPQYKDFVDNSNRFNVVDELYKVIERHKEGTYSMHSHTGNGKEGTIPSFSDLEILQTSKNNTAVIFTSKGVLCYRCEKKFDAYSELNDFLNSKYTLKYPRIFTSSHSNITTFMNLSLVIDDKNECISLLVEILDDFYRTFNIITEEANWEDEKGCQKIIDDYFIT